MSEATTDDIEQPREVPARDDFLDLIMAHESEGLSEEDEARMFADPRCRHLQGHYSSRCTAP
jgi:hypothetical protein